MTPLTLYVTPEITRMSTFRESVQAIEQNIDAKNARINELETCLNRFVLAHENLLSDTEGKYPPADTGCIDCTSGCVPDKYNTGPCPYHTAKRLLGQL